MDTITEQVHEAVRDALLADTERLEIDCARAMMWQDYDYIDRLTIVVDQRTLPWTRSVASMVTDG